MMPLDPGVNAAANVNQYAGSFAASYSGPNPGHIGQVAATTPAGDAISAISPSDILRNLTSTAENLASKPGLADRCVARSMATLTTTEALVAQQTPLDDMLSSGSVDVDQLTDKTATADQGASSSKTPQQRLTELSFLPGAAVSPLALRTVSTLDNQSTRAEFSSSAVGARSVPAADSVLNQKVVQLTLEKDNGLSGSKHQHRYSLATSGLQSAQPVEPSQPRMKSPVGGLSVAQTGLEIRSVQQNNPSLAVVTIEPDTDAGRRTLSSLDNVQRDRITTLNTSLAGNLTRGNVSAYFSAYGGGPAG